MLVATQPFPTLKECSTRCLRAVERHVLCVREALLGVGKN